MKSDYWDDSFAQWADDLDLALARGEELLMRSCVFCQQLGVHRCGGGFARYLHCPALSDRSVGIFSGLVDADHWNLTNYELDADHWNLTNYERC